MALAISVVTIVSTNAGFSGIMFIFVFSLKIYSAINIPDIFPVKLIYSPVFVSLAYTPSLSASGSVASTISASFSFASLSANSQAFSSSGLGYATVGNVPSGNSCSFTTSTFSKPSSFNTFLTGMFPVP